MRDAIRFQPLYQERVWGGRVLESALGRTLPPGGPIGESWEIVDRPEAQSVVRGGPFDGLTLRRLIEQRAPALMGPRWRRERAFPLLVKWLDCRERLSLQVHPPASLAAELRGEPKTENWFIGRASPGAHLVVGLRPGCTREAFENAVAAGDLEPCLNRFPVRSGDSILVESGTVHAIDGGNLILEIQQNSDTTYRVYDWGRMGLDGRPRKMHLKEALRSIQWDAPVPAPVRSAPVSAVLATCAHFTIRRQVLAPGEKLRVNPGEQPRLLSVISGQLVSGTDALLPGENVLLPYAAALEFTAAGEVVALLTEDFAGLK